MKKWTTLSLSAAMALSLAACSSSEKPADSTGGDTGETQDVTLTVWSPQDDQADDYGNWLGKMQENFAAAHPEYNITWKNEVCQEGDVGDKVAQDPENSADVYLFANDQIGKLKDANAIAELGGNTLEQIKADNSEVVVDSVTQDGAVYGVPFTTNTWFMYYNKSMVSEDEIKSLDDIIAKNKITFPVSNSWYLPAFYYADGGTMFGDNGQDAAAGIQFDKPAATEYLVALKNNSNFADDADGKGYAAFSEKETAVFFSGSWDYQTLKDALGDDLGAAQLPTAKIGGEDKQLYSFAGSKAIGVNPNCENQAAAVAFAAYLGGEEAQKAHWEDRMIIPTNTTLLEDEVFAKDMLVKAQNDTVDNTAKIQPTLTEMGNYWKIGENFGKAIIAGDVTEANAKDKTVEFQKQLNTLTEE